MQPLLNSATLSPEQLARLFDHAVLTPELGEEDVIDACTKARAYHISSVHVKPAFCALAARLLQGSDVIVGIPIGFPHGGHSTRIKIAEAEEAFANGAGEIDMVINAGLLRSGRHEQFQAEIAALVEIGRRRGACVKAICLNAWLTPDERRTAWRLAAAAGVDFIKTATGFDPAGATVEDVRAMWAMVGPGVQVKAAGGITDLATASALIDAGATRLGTKWTFEILDEARPKT